MTDRESSETERFRRVETIFHAAIALAEEARPRFVREQAAGDEALAKRLLGMLQADDRADTTTSLLERARRNAVPAGALVGARLGRYRLVEFLGDGSFGEVYAGEQLEPIRRRVAVKVLYAAVSAEGSVERFQDEAQALAAMSHAGIAHIFDAGHDSPSPASPQRDSASGLEVAPPRLYLVMEHVEGASITTFAAHERLDTAARIGLIASVADAVQHAHQKGIIHRDLKPSNILVNRVDGVLAPKVIDFGVAKVIEGPHVHAGGGEASRGGLAGAPIRSARVVRRELSGTPQYMSPEQGDLARSADVDTRTDIYSLGVILYELVTGLVPFEAGRTQERRILPPSTRQLSEPGGTSAIPPIPRAMRGDLDHIVMKALEADPERRYASAGAFADDLRRLLRGDAVLAAPQTLRYRLRTAIWRHRVATTIAAMLLLAATIASIGIITGMVRARAEAARGDAINGFMRDVLTSVNPDRGGAHVELATVLNDASRLAAERFAGRPEVEAETRMLLGSIDVNLGRYPEALVEYRAAERLRSEAFGAESIPALESTIAATQVELARSRVADVAPGLPNSCAACTPRAARGIATQREWKR
jgi:serine/threonine protein kinase